MSTIIGIVNDEGVWMGADTQATAILDSHIRPFKVRKMYKNQDYIFGCSGSIRGAQCFQPQYFTPPKDISEMADAMHQHCDKKAILIAGEEGSIYTPTTFLIAFKNKLYELTDDFQIHEVETYSALGSGAYFALGSLHSISELNDTLKLSPYVMIELALKAAAAMSGSTGPPFEIIKCE